MQIEAFEMELTLQTSAPQTLTQQETADNVCINITDGLHCSSSPEDSQFGENNVDPENTAIRYDLLKSK